MKLIHAIVSGVIWVAVLSDVVVAQQPPVSTNQIAEAITQLGAPTFAEREKASKFLWSVGEPALPALQQAVRAPDPEVSMRARRILEKLQWGIDGDTPREMVGLIEQLRAGSEQEQLKLVDQFLQQGEAAYPVLRAVSRSGVAPAFVQRVAQKLQKTQQQTLPQSAELLTEDQYNRIEVTLELAASTGDENARQRCIALLLLRGRLDQAIEQRRAQLPVTPSSAVWLALMYRAKGDLAQAMEAARKAGQPSLLRALLLELGDWEELARLTMEEDPGSSLAARIEHLGMMALYQRFNGQMEASAKSVNAIVELVNSTESTWNKADERVAVEMLLLNGRINYVLDMLVRRQKFTEASLLLANQLRYREAIDLLDKAEKSGADAKELKSLKHRNLYLVASLGESDKARSLWEDCVKEAEKLPDRNQLTSLAYQARIHGWYDLMESLCVKVLGMEDLSVSVSRVIPSAFPESSVLANLLWTKWQADDPSQDVAERFHKLRVFLVSGRPAIVTALEEMIKDEQLADRDKWLAQLALVYDKAGQPEKAIALYAQIHENTLDADQLQRWADACAKANQWAQAAELYGKAINARPGKVSWLYLKGRALVEAGQAEQAEKTLEHAQLLASLSKGSLLLQAADILRNCGLDDHATQELRRMIVTGPFDPWELSHVHSRLADMATKANDHAAALQHLHQEILYYLQATNVRLGTLSLARNVLKLEACQVRLWLATGELDRALALARSTLQQFPNDVDFAADVILALDAAGRAKDAEELYESVYKVHEAVCREYPRSATHHNALAWLSARCMRRLDEALVHAETAVKFAPGQATILGTLAEVHFVRGDRDRALEINNKCIELEPYTKHYQQQRQRFGQDAK